MDHAVGIMKMSLQQLIATLWFWYTVPGMITFTKFFLTNEHNSWHSAHLCWKNERLCKSSGSCLHYVDGNCVVFSFVLHHEWCSWKLKRCSRELESFIHFDNKIGFILLMLFLNCVRVGFCRLCCVLYLVDDVRKEICVSSGLSILTSVAAPRCTHARCECLRYT